MEKIQFRGIMPALITPFDEEERLIVPSVKKLMDYEYAKGVDGFYVGGATGEGPVLPVATRMALCEAAVEANAGRGKIIMHIGGPNFRDVAALVRHATEAGVDGISSMAPNAYYAHTDAELVDYYKRIADMTDKPVMLYVTNLMLGNNLDRVFTELMAVDNIIGLKFTQPNYYLLSLLKMINGGDINIINGPDEMLLCGLSMGADGGIGSTYNLMPDRFSALYAAFRRGDMEEARRIQFAINRVIRVLLDFGGGSTVIRNIKAAMNAMGFDAGVCAYPTLSLNGEETAALVKQLKAAGLEM